jgi:uncharacterized protein (TIGR02246 family)
MQKYPLLVSVLGLAALALAALLVSAQSKPAERASVPSAIEKAVLETNDKMTRAADSLNADAFFEYVLDSGKSPVIQNGIVFKTRQEALESVKRGFAGLAKTERRFDHPQVTVLSPDAALLTSDGTVFATLPDGRTLTNRFAVSLVFVRKDGRWRLLHGHYSAPPNQGQ